MILEKFKIGEDRNQLKMLFRLISNRSYNFHWGSNLINKMEEIIKYYHDQIKINYPHWEISNIVSLVYFKYMISYIKFIQQLYIKQ